MGNSVGDQRGGVASNAAEKSLLLASQAGKLDDIDRILRNASPSERRAMFRTVHCRGQAGLTSTHWCAKLGHVGCLALLVDAGANIEVRTSAGHTPLILAVCAGHVDCVRFLTSRGANVNVCTRQGDTPLHFAAQNSPSQGIACLELLLQSGANVDKKCENGWTALHWAARECHPEYVRALLAAGCTVDVMDHLRVTALGEAAREGCVESVRALLSAGASVQQRDIGDNLPLHEAVQNGHVSCAAALLKAGTVANERGAKWNTALHMAIKEHHPACIQLLLESGADPYLNNRLSMTCVDLTQTARRDVCYMTREYVKFLDHGQWYRAKQRSESSSSEGNQPKLWPLSKLCRFSIRRAMGACRVNSMDLLPIPGAAKKFLLFEDTPDDDIVRGNCPDQPWLAQMTMRSSALEQTLTSLLKI